MRHTRAHTANRRSHHALKGATFSTCQKCGAKHLAHRVCMQCGTYRGRVVLDVMAKTVKRQKKAEAEKAKATGASKPAAKKAAAKGEKKEDKKTA
ncbi:MAG TPA: 50S ribosomal protein L32 [Candidatus Paceibacterota bacterium]|nr:50S ribosomal protein L32 [Candidatus Paceibacterota bacterium]